jgi:hypothetical protein
VKICMAIRIIQEYMALKIHSGANND